MRIARSNKLSQNTRDKADHDSPENPHHVCLPQIVSVPAYDKKSAVRSRRPLIQIESSVLPVSVCFGTRAVPATVLLAANAAVKWFLGTSAPAVDSIFIAAVAAVILCAT